MLLLLLVENNCGCSTQLKAARTCDGLLLALDYIDEASIIQQAHPFFSTLTCQDSSSSAHPPAPTSLADVC
jgi:hypothetical protein